MAVVSQEELFGTEVEEVKPGIAQEFEQGFESEQFPGGIAVPFEEKFKVGGEEVGQRFSGGILEKMKKEMAKSIMINITKLSASERAELDRLITKYKLRKSEWAEKRIGGAIYYSITGPEPNLNAFRKEWTAFIKRKPEIPTMPAERFLINTAGLGPEDKKRIIEMAKKYGLSARYRTIGKSIFIEILGSPNKVVLFRTEYEAWRGGKILPTPAIPPARIVEYNLPIHGLSEGEIARLEILAKAFGLGTRRVGNLLLEVIGPRDKVYRFISTYRGWLAKKITIPTRPIMLRKPYLGPAVPTMLPRVMIPREIPIIRKPPRVTIPREIPIIRKPPRRVPVVPVPPRRVPVVPVPPEKVPAVPAVRVPKPVIPAVPKVITPEEAKKLQAQLAALRAEEQKLLAQYASLLYKLGATHGLMRTAVEIERARIRALKNEIERIQREVQYLRGLLRA